MSFWQYVKVIISWCQRSNHLTRCQMYPILTGLTSLLSGRGLASECPGSGSGVSVSPWLRGLVTTHRCLSAGRGRNVRTPGENNSCGPDAVSWDFQLEWLYYSCKVKYLSVYVQGVSQILGYCCLSLVFCEARHQGINFIRDLTTSSRRTSPRMGAALSSSYI